MYCPACGTKNDDNAKFCQSCGKSLLPETPAPVPQRPVPNYLVQAILVTIFCCLPFGIVAIVYAAQVNSKLAAGDYNGAMASSNSAKIWTWVSFGLGLAGVLIYAIIAVLGGMAGFRS